jgi:predicted MFS family arabinose efflux permease
VIRGPRTILALLTALNLLNYLDRFVLPAVLKEIKQELDLSGLLAGNLATVFLIGYFATSPIFGTWADRAGRGGRKALIALGIAIWSAATFASGLSRGAASLVASRAFVGIGEASYATIAPTLIDEVAPPARKGGWLAIFFAAIPVGSALGYLLGGAVLGITHNWRSAFFVAGGPGIVLAAVCLLIAEPSQPPVGAGVGEGSTPRADVWGSARVLARLPLYRSAVLGYCAYTFALGGFAHWAPYYISSRFGVATGEASFRFGLVTVAGGAIGTFVGGWMGDRRARGLTDDMGISRAALSVCTFSAGLGAPLAAAAVLAPTANAFYSAVLLCEIALFLHFGPFNVVILRSVPFGLRASAMALSIFASHLLGDLWSPPLIGLASDHAPVLYAMLLVPLGFALAALVWRAAPVRLT